MTCSPQSLRPRAAGLRRRFGRFQSVAQFVERRLCGALRNRRCAAARTGAQSAGRSAGRSGTASCAITSGVRAGENVAERRRHFLDAEHASNRRLRRFRCAPSRRRLCLTIWRRRLRGGSRRREDKCRDNREFVHIGHLRALLQHQSGQARCPARLRLARRSHQGK